MIGMRIGDLLSFAIACSLLLNWPVTAILIRAAAQHPPITFLWAVAMSSLLISVATTGFVLHAIDGGILGPDIESISFRLFLLLAAAFPVWWLWLYLTGRFR